MFQVEKVYRVGLVAKNDEAYVKASCDFVAVAVINGEKHLVGIECKARVTPGTHQQEMRQAEFLSHFHRAGDHQQQTYTLVQAASSDFHIYVDSPHEAVQLLHLSYVYSFKYVLLLVGDRVGNIIRGVCVHFDRLLLQRIWHCAKIFLPKCFVLGIRA